jgi:hypothetical protein
MPFGRRAKCRNLKRLGLIFFCKNRWNREVDPRLLRYLFRIGIFCKHALAYYSMKLFCSGEVCKDGTAVRMPGDRRAQPLQHRLSSAPVPR